MVGCRARRRPRPALGRSAVALAFDATSVRADQFARPGSERRGRDAIALCVPAGRLPCRVAEDHRGEVRAAHGSLWSTSGGEPSTETTRTSALTRVTGLSSVHQLPTRVDLRLCGGSRVGEVGKVSGGRLIRRVLAAHRDGNGVRCGLPRLPRSPGFLKESGKDGVVVLISMCNRRPDCGGPDWTIVPWKESSRRHPCGAGTAACPPRDSGWGRSGESAPAASRCCDLVCGGYWGRSSSAPARLIGGLDREVERRRRPAQRCRPGARSSDMDEDEAAEPAPMPPRMVWFCTMVTWSPNDDPRAGMSVFARLVGESLEPTLLGPGCVLRLLRALIVLRLGRVQPVSGPQVVQTS